MSNFDRVWNKEPATGTFDKVFWSQFPEHFAVRQFYDQFDGARATRFRIWTCWEVQDYNYGPNDPHKTGRLVFGGISWLFGSGSDKSACETTCWFALELSMAPAEEVYVFYREAIPSQPQTPAILDHPIGPWSRLIDLCQSPLEQPVLSHDDLSAV
ncbi:MAG: hypothetical protein AB8B85_07570 [Paracoccaceae bacterium]